MTSIKTMASRASAGVSVRSGTPTEIAFAMKPALLYAAAVVLAVVAATNVLPENPSFVPATLLEGAIGGSVWMAAALAFSWMGKRAVSRWLLALLLLVAALFYVVFALQEGAAGVWVAGEVLGVAIFGVMALRGLRGSPWWLAAGWALHPVWDIGLHSVGPGTFAPAAYPIACLTFDLVVAGYIAVAYGWPWRRVAEAPSS